MGLFHGEVNNFCQVAGKDRTVKRNIQMLMNFLSLKSELYVFKILFFNCLYLIKYE